MKTTERMLMKVLKFFLVPASKMRRTSPLARALAMSSSPTACPNAWPCQGGGEQLVHEGNVSDG